jgi:hypothetical protein
VGFGAGVKLARSKPTIRSIFVCLAIVLVTSPNCLWAQSGQRHNQLKIVLSEFQEAFKNNKNDALEHRLVFPYSWESGCSEIIVSNLKDFKKIEADVFDEKIQKAVLEQSADDIFLNQDGAFFGEHGDLWINAFDDAMPISSVNSAKGHLSKFLPSQREPLKSNIAGRWTYDHATSVGGHLRDWATNISNPNSIFIDLESDNFDSSGIKTKDGSTILETCQKCSGTVWVVSEIIDPDANADKGSLTYFGIDDIPGQTVNIRACTPPNRSGTLN